MNFLGLDLSVANTGVVVINRDTKILHQDVIKTKPKSDIEMRIAVIHTQVAEVVNAFAPDFIYIEELAHGARGDAILELAGVNYFVRTRFYQAGIRYKMIAPGTLKKFITGKGNAKKELMLKEVYKRWGADFNDNNECDAYCLARMALEQNKPKETQPLQPTLKLR